MATDDHSLVQRARSGDERAFRLLVERYQKKVYAVALGMVAAAQISAERAGLQKQEIEELVGLIRRFDLPTKLPESLPRSQILDKVFADKKFVNRKIRFVVTPKLGSAFLAENITVEDLESGLKAIDPSQK